MKRITCAFWVLFVGLLGLLSLAAEGSQKIQGKVEGFGNTPKDGIVDVSAVFPSLTEDQILSFDFAALMSPNEPMKAGPMSTEVPGNVFIPRQSENYGWIPITLEKQSFSVYLEPGEENELFSVAIKAPFEESVKKAREKAPASQLVKLMKFNKLGFARAKDWSKERNVTLHLNQSRPKTTQVRWTRPRADASEVDLKLNFEETPMGRWLLSDMNTDPQTVTPIASTSFAGKAKVMLARSKFNSANEFLWMRSWFVTHERPSSLEMQNIPSALSNVRWDKNTLITWTGSAKLGWVTVLIEEPKSPSEIDDKDLSAESLFLKNLLLPLRSIAHPLIRSEWTRVEEGRLILAQTPKARSTVTLVFLGGQRLTGAPNLSDAEELHVYNLTKN
jgi:hypothetical protein